MKIRTQFLITMILFSIIVVAISASVIYTNLEVDKLNREEATAHRVERGARELSYISNDYLLYREGQQRTRWESRFAQLSGDLSQLVPNNPEQQALLNNILTNQLRLKEVFADVTSILENQPTTAADLAFIQVSWSRMEVQNQGIIFDSLRLADMFSDQVEEARQTNLRLIFVLMVIFGAYFIANYTLVFRRIFKSISELQAGTRVIGFGNLDYTLEEKTNDEVGELSRSFNRMTASLKTVTASKADLEREITARKEAEEELRTANENLQEKALELEDEIDERKKAEEAAHRLAEEWQTTFDSIADMVSIQDKDFRLVRVNQAYENTVGKKKEELAGKRCYEVVHGTSCPVACCPHAQTLKNGRSYTEEIFEPRLGVYLEASTSPIRDGKGEVVGTVHIAKDITERKQSQEKMLALEKLSLLGKVAGSISHELRNPLAVVDSSIYYLTSRFQKLGKEAFSEDKAKEHFERMRLAIQRSVGIIQSLLDLTHMKEPQTRRVDLRAVAQQLIRDCELPATLKIDLDFPGQEVPVNADLLQLGMAFGNIITNARQAMNGEGTLTVRIKEADGRAEISFTDTGPGIAPENLPRMFEPLFTTKAQGIGLGLPIAKMIVERHHGTIHVKSEASKGTTITVRLRLAEISK